MELLASFFQAILDLGSSVFMPLVVLIIGLIVGLKPSKAFGAGLTLGVAIVGINLVVSYMSTSIGEPVQGFVETLGLQLSGLDMGWSPALGLVWSWRYVFLMFVIQIAINVVMLLINQTDTLNVDMWNVANQGFTAFLIYCVTGSVVAGFIAGGIQVILELKSSDATKYQIQELTGCPGIGMPHPMFLSNIIFYPIACVRCSAGQDRHLWREPRYRLHSRYRYRPYRRPGRAGIRNRRYGCNRSYSLPDGFQAVHDCSDPHLRGCLCMGSEALPRPSDGRRPGLADPRW